MDIFTLILAAGKGKRMNSNLPKVLQKIAGKALIAHILDNLSEISSRQGIIFGHQGDILKAYLEQNYPNLQWIKQSEQLGTGHAVMQALPFQDNELVLIMTGDTPLISASTLKSLLNLAQQNDITLLSANFTNPFGYGRIVRDKTGVCAIIEEKDASPEQKIITEINSGIMAVKGKILNELLPEIKNDNAQQEYYLTDIVSLAYARNYKIEAFITENSDEIQGINDKLQLANAERIFQTRKVNELLQNGATIIDPSRIDIQGDLQIGKDVYIEPNVVFKGENIIEDNVIIESFCVIENTIIKANSRILSHSRLENSVVGENSEIGPYARLRPQTVLANNVKIGNFVELKASTVKEGSKINHLSYIGNTEIGSKVNIGAGTITCNYDGVNKHQTKIQDNVFIGSNSALVAPLEIEENSTIGAGSTVRDSVSKNSLFLSKAEKVIKNPWLRKKK